MFTAQKLRVFDNRKPVIIAFSGEASKILRNVSSFGNPVFCAMVSIQLCDEDDVVTKQIWRPGEGGGGGGGRGTPLTE